MLLEDCLAQIRDRGGLRTNVGYANTFHEAFANAVFAHQRKAALCVYSERLEGQRGDH